MCGPVPMKAATTSRLVYPLDSLFNIPRSVTGAMAATALNSLGSTAADCSAAYPPYDHPTIAMRLGSAIPWLASHLAEAVMSPIEVCQLLNPFCINHASPKPADPR